MRAESIWDFRIGSVLIQHAGWKGGQHGWRDPYRLTFVSVPSRRFWKVDYRGIGWRPDLTAPSTVINWVRRFQATGGVAPHKPKAIVGEHHVFLVQRIRDRELTLRGLKVDYRSVWNFVHAEKLGFKKTVIASERDRPDICTILDLRFQALSDEITACHSSLGGEFGEWIDVVKDASQKGARRRRRAMARAGAADAPHP
jgi:hypothetical protein